MLSFSDDVPIVINALLAKAPLHSHIHSILHEHFLLLYISKGLSSNLRHEMTIAVEVFVFLPILKLLIPIYAHFPYETILINYYAEMIAER